MYLETRDQQPSINLIPGGGSFGGDGFGGSGGSTLFFFLIIFFFLILFMGWGNNNNGNGNGNGGNGGGNVQFIPYPSPYMMGGFGGGNSYQAADIIRQGFDQSAVIGGINGLQNQLQNGFSNAEVSRCNQQANILATMNNNQNATTAALQAQAMAFQNCCCENRAGLADVKYNIVTEACADRAAVTNALQDLTAQNNANMNTLLTAFNNGVQSLKDQATNARIADLERQLNYSQISDLVNNSRNSIISNNDLQTSALEQYLAPVAKPAYIVQNPGCCQQNTNPCNCNRCYN